jgi:hypothetical protein
MFMQAGIVVAQLWRVAVFNLDGLLGKTITLSLMHSEEAGYDVTLRGVETGGIWVQGPSLDKLIGYERPKKSKVSKVPPKRPIIFIPYAQIAFVLTSSTELDEKSLRGE